MLKKLPTVVAPFDYSALPKARTKRIRQLADGIRSRMRRTAEELIAIGRDLVEVKEALPHGQFGPWLEAEFGWSDRTARRLMAIADNLGDWKSDIMSVLPPSALFPIASAPKKARQEIVKRVEAGERLRVSDIERIVKKSRGRQADANDKYMRLTNFDAASIRAALVEIVLLELDVGDVHAVEIARCAAFSWLTGQQGAALRAMRLMARGHVPKYTPDIRRPSYHKGRLALDAPLPLGPGRTRFSDE